MNKILITKISNPPNFSGKFPVLTKRVYKIRIFFILLFLFPAILFAQKSIKGTITDESGQGLSDVSVLIKGTKLGVTTDNAGKFSITLPVNRNTLVLTHVGYQIRQVVVNNQSDLGNIVLSTSTNQMDEVVVIGYGTQKKSDITGAVGGINSEKLNRNKSTDILSALQGKIAGVEIMSQSGELGAGFSIKVRGSNSINGSSSPLFVIDGIPIDVNSGEVAGSSLAGSTSPNPLANINPQDIEAIEVLKDASATAIYGSRGANGVILITTKSGKIGKSTVEYSGNVRFNSLSKKLNVLGADDYLKLRIERFGPNDGVVMQMDPNKDGVIDVPTHDWQDEIYQSSVSQDHTVTMSSGNKTTQFSGSLNYLDDNGIIITNNNKRYGARLRVDHNINEKLKAGINLNISENQINGATNSGGAFQGSTRTILFSRPVDIYTPGDASDGFDVYVSPKTNIENSYLTSNTSRLLGNVTAAYKFAKNFTFNVVAGGGISNSKGKEFYSSQTTGGVKSNGAASVQNIHTFNWTNTNQLTYNKPLPRNSSLNLIGVFELSSYGFESNSMSAENFPYQGTGIDDIAKALTITGVNTYKYKNNRVSYLSRANYSLMNKYLFTASIRADGSDKFGPNNKYGYFPSGAFAWKIGDENFMKNAKYINNLKLRLSYGITGNEKIDPYSYLSLLNNYYYASNGTAQLGLAPSNPGNADLKWEESTAYNAGLDFSLFNNRLEFTTDIYLKEVKNMLIKSQLPTQGGYYSQYQNLGRVDNHGIEFSVTSHAIRKANFTWDMDFNLTYNESKVKSLGNASSQPITVGGDITNVGILMVGQPFGSGYGYIGDGVYQLTDFNLVGTTYVLKAGVPAFSGATVQPGSYKFKDISGPSGKPDGIIDSYDQQVISHSQPKYAGGFNSTIHYKGLDFTFFLQGVAGRQVINEIKLDLTGWKANKNQGTDFYNNRWTPTNPTNTYGTFSDLNVTSRYNSTFYVEDASFLRLKSLSVGYTFTNKLGQGSRVRAYVTGNNLLTITNYTGYDPEVSYKNDLFTGFDGLAYPRSRSVVVGLTATF